MKVPRSVAVMIVLVALALIAAVAIMGRATADMAADDVTTLGSRDDAEYSGSLLGALEGTCPADGTGIDSLNLGRFAPIDNGRSESPAPGSTAIVMPSRLRIPSIDLDARILAVAQDTFHRVVVPTDISAVGWYEFGPAPGDSTGSCVLVAHRDGVSGGRGAFYELGNVKPGNFIYVTMADGTELGYRVVSREMVAKTWLSENSNTFFTSVGKERLTLITCGGVYDKARGGYQSNIIVTARPEN